MSKIKILNDPIYGLVSFPFPFLYELIDHRYFQRLRRIQQLGMSSIVYPGATHSRFHHALGAMHLCDRTIQTLRQKGLEITDLEYEATLAATLLHDIGHGPYSHALEFELIPVHHEKLTLDIMKRLNHEFDGRLTMAIDIFRDQYEKKYLHQIISGQIDVDRMDYLNRDSFYTGVAEGIIGYDRIIKMVNVAHGELVIEEKGLLSIEKFLLSRYFMYKQVYLHTAALTADHMLKTFFKKYKTALLRGEVTSESLLSKIIFKGKSLGKSKLLALFLQVDDSDIIQLLKENRRSKDAALKSLAEGLLDRKLYQIKKQNEPFSDKKLKNIKKMVASKSNLADNDVAQLISLGVERTQLYNDEKQIKILKKKDGSIVTFSSLSRLNLYQHKEKIHFVTYPK